MRFPALKIVILTTWFVTSCGNSNDATTHLHESLPHGWRRPHPEELRPDRCGERPRSPLELDVDLNGDGKLDKALIAVNEAREKVGLFVSVSKPLTYEWQILDTRDGTCATYGLDVVQPGQYRGFFCPARSADCAPKSMEVIRTVYPGIVFFDIGRAGVTVFWNAEAGGFDRMWEGD